MIIAAVAVVAIGGYSIYVFVKKPTSAQLKCVKEWLLWAVTEAERQFGSGTGQLKLRFVYNMFIERFDYLADIITFDMVSALVDEALEKMKSILETNKAVETYVKGE
jgi:hypothetical protein